MANKTTADTKIEPDEVFEAFLAARTESETLILLARASFYGETIFEILYPEDAAAPPDIVYPDTRRASRFARPSYRGDDVAEAGKLWREFADANWDRFVRYRNILLELLDEDGS